MRYLIKKAKIVTPEKISQRKDILIDNGKIKEIARSIEDNKATILESKNMHVSIGWCDIGTQIGEPGFEERETIESIIRSATHGGYTALAPFPNLDPVVDSKSTIRFIKSEFESSAIDVHPIGAVSKLCQGKDISEMVDMHNSGAIAFSDGNKSIQNSGVVLRALQYTKSINSLIIQHPNDKSLSEGTEIHEGFVSTSLGLPGNPEESELIMAKRDVDLAHYAEAPICLHNISSGQTVDVLKKSKKKNDKIYASTSSMHLLHTDEDLETFDPMYKIQPPLRSREDRKALVKGINTDVLQYISSNHTPVELENKDLEFQRSKKGASTLDTVFSSLNTYLEEVDLKVLVKKLAYGSREVLGIRVPEIKEGELANICVFDPTSVWTVDQSKIYSKSKNNPYIGEELVGEVLAVFNNKKAIIHN